MEIKELKPVIEGVLFATGDAVGIDIEGKVLLGHGVFPSFELLFGPKICL